MLIETTREVISNLMSNAIKYTDLGTISINVIKKDKLALISVTDTGVGISQDNLPHIFEKFYLSENWIKKQSQSNGLGLYITKLLLELMDGKITVESQEGKGSRFTFSLPLAKNR